jgi:hypothetical protein
MRPASSPRALVARGWGLPGAIATLLLLSSRATLAQPRPDPVRFAWVRADGADACAGADQIAERVTARLGGSPFSSDAARSLEAIVSRREHGFRAGIYVRGPDGALLGTRELTSEAPDCGSIEAASVLAIALAIDPEAMTRSPPAAAPVTPATPPLAPPALAPPALPPLPAPPLPAALPAPADRGLGHSGAALRGAVGLGLLPGPAPGVGIAAYAALGRVAQLTGEALWLPEARTADGRFGFGLAAFALGACAVVADLRSADLAACGAVWAGALHAVVYDLEPARPGDYAWAAASATPRLRVRLLPRVHAELGAHLLVPLVRRPFVVSGWAEPVFRQAPVTTLLFAGVGVHFP